MNYDVDFKEEDARKWIGAVESEVQAVQELLKNVTALTTAAEAEQDTIMLEMQQAGQELDEFWGKMCVGFEHVIGQLGKVFDSLTNAVSDTLDAIGALARRIKD